jgi:D-alanine-D-alanine ligase-like ATP-grasp enzyme
MNYVFLSPHFPPNWFRFVVALRQAGATTLGIADSTWEALRPELRDALSDYYRVDDLADYDQLARALGWFIHRHGRIDGIDSLNEHWLEIEARARTDFNIAGIDVTGIAAVKRKSLMKERFVEVGIPVARGRICHTRHDLAEWITEVGFPVVAKPDIGVGAAQTYRLDDPDDVERYLRDKPPVDYIVEEYVDGQIVTYDGLAGPDGEIVFESSLRYSTGVMESVNDQLDLHYWVTRQVAADVRAVGRRMASAFDVRARPFHFEMFRTDDGRLVGLEVNLRPPGGLTVDMWNYANDFDFYRHWASVVVHGRPDGAVGQPRYACLYVSRRDGRAYALSQPDVLSQYGPLVVLETRMDGMFSSAMGDQAFILRGEDEDVLVAAAQAIAALA